MTNTTSRTARRLWPVAVLAVAAAAVLSACGTGAAKPSNSSPPVTTQHNTSPVSDGSSAAPSTTAASTKPTKPAKIVHVSSLESDDGTYGVGMPIVLYFSPVPTNSQAFTNAVKVTVNGAPANGAWFWEQPTHDDVVHHIIEAHYRMSHYWPKYSKIHVSIPIKGLSAGKGLAYSGALNSLSLNIGAAHISTVNGQAERMEVTSNGKLVKTIKVSLGAAQTPTYTGTKVVMQKGEDTPGTDTLRPDGAVRMIGPGYDELVDWSVRVTNSGEYVHAAPWNTHLGQLSTSNGCTNLSTADADWFYHFSQLGDVVTYANTDGTTMPSWDGLGDWNVPWTQWAAGGLLLNH